MVFDPVADVAAPAVPTSDITKQPTATVEIPTFFVKERTVDIGLSLLQLAMGTVSA